MSGIFTSEDLTLEDLADGDRYDVILRGWRVPVVAPGRAADGNYHADVSCDRIDPGSELDTVSTDTLADIPAAELCDCALKLGPMYDDLVRAELEQAAPLLRWVRTAAAFLAADHDPLIAPFATLARPQIAAALLEHRPTVPVSSPTLDARVTDLTAHLDALVRLRNDAAALATAHQKLEETCRQRIKDSWSRKVPNPGDTAQMMATKLHWDSPLPLAYAKVITPAVVAACNDTVDNTSAWVLGGSIPGGVEHLPLNGWTREDNLVSLALRTYPGPGVAGAVVPDRWWEVYASHGAVQVPTHQGARPLRVPATVLAVAYQLLQVDAPLVVTTRDDVDGHTVFVAAAAAAATEESERRPIANWDPFLDAAKTATSTS